MKDEKNVMRINNKRIIPVIETLYTLLFIGIFIAILLIIIPIGFITNLISPYILLGLFIISIFLFYKFGHQHFEYNSDGEVINIKTQDIFWVKYFPNSKSVVDFPKKKLINFKIEKKFFRETLELYVTSKRTSNGITKLKFNITYLKEDEIADLKRSLSKIIKNNKEQQTDEVEAEL